MSNQHFFRLVNMRMGLLFLGVVASLWARSYGIGEEVIEEGKDYVVDKGKGKLVSYSKNGVRSVIDKLPGGKFLTDLFLDDGESIEEKVDRIDKNQKTALGKIRDISSKVLRAKRKIEELWFYKTLTIDRASSLADQLQKSQGHKFLGVALENWLKIPINPAEYIPNIPPTQKLKEALNYDLSIEKGAVRETKYLLSHTRAALLASGLDKTNPKEFQRQYQEAEEYEALLKEAMRAKGITTTKVYKAHKDRLEKQIEVLEKHQTEKGLTVGEVLQMEMVIDNKRRHIRELEQAIEKDLQQAMVLSDQDKIAAAAAQSQKDIKRLEVWLEEERLSRQKSKR